MLSSVSGVGKHLSDMFPIKMIQNEEILYRHCFLTLH